MKRPADADAPRTELLVKGRKFDFARIFFTGSDGAPASLEVVRHPGAAVVLPVMDDGSILLIRNHRPVVDAALWELPAGTLERGENPADCAARELAEEAGYAASRLEPLGVFFTTPGMTDERMFAFAAFDLRPVGQRLERDERIEVARKTVAEALALLDAGRLQDAKSMLALLLALRRGLIRAGAPVEAAP